MKTMDEIKPMMMMLMKTWVRNTLLLKHKQNLPQYYKNSLNASQPSTRKQKQLLVCLLTLWWYYTTKHNSLFTSNSYSISSNMFQLLNSDHQDNFVIIYKCKF